MNYFLEYLAISNVVGFVLFGYDKFLAKARQRRIPESTLMIVAAIGGSVGCYVSMMLFHHKTRRFKFKFGIPALFILQVALYVLYKIYL
ncbi:DUF1294 domain-containing protein [Hydrogenoanaerobacterium sp.]|uniref:DUF1294 domain-containing protein n=1 Tax=Hydrogenoanaerobacterium sp. TaxID=2953763 RepID=UPI0028990EF0|nr:DUF1294 domain-containing protein [Hydrogenoanaerobacterium sp.]